MLLRVWILINLSKAISLLYTLGYCRDLTEKEVLPQGQKVVCHHQSIRCLQEPHRSAIQNGGAEETLFIHTPQYWSATRIHHHPIVERQQGGEDAG